MPLKRQENKHYKKTERRYGIPSLQEGGLSQEFAHILLEKKERRYGIPSLQVMTYLSIRFSATE